MKSKIPQFISLSSQACTKLLMAISACVCHYSTARAATFTYNNNIQNTSPGENWSQGTNWNAVPVGAVNTILDLTGALADGVSIFSNNDIAGDFKLNRINFTYSGPETGSKPTITFSGSPLEFVSNGTTVPALYFTNTGTIKPEVIIDNPLVLTNSLSVLAGSAATLGGIISGPGNLKMLAGGGQTLRLVGDNSYAGTTTVNGGALAAVGSHAFGSTTGISISGSGILKLLGDSSTSFVKADDDSSYAVTTTASDATIHVDQATAAGTAAKTMTIGTIALNLAGTNQTHFTGANHTSLSIGAMSTGTSVGGTEIINNPNVGGGSLTIANVNVLRTGSPTLKFDGAGHTIVSGAISQVASTALNKSGTGMLTLNGDCGLTGTTTVNKGTLHLTGSLDSAVSVKNTGTLSGTGSVSGNVSVLSGGHLAFALAANPAAQNPLNIAGTLSLSTGNIIDLLIESTAPIAGEYILASAAGTTYNLPSTVNLAGIAGTVSVINNNLVLTVAGSTATYENWASTIHGLSGGNADFDFDFDHDGIDNGLEWILGGNPTNGASSVSPQPASDVSNNLVLAFTREEDSIAKTSLMLEYGNSLNGWTSFIIDADGGTGPNGVSVVINQVAEPDACTVTIPAAIAAPGGRIFARLKAIKTP